MCNKKAGTFVSFFLIVLLVSQNSRSQFFFSTTANGQSAFLASRMDGHSFVANPAFLGRFAPQKKYFLQTEYNTSEAIYLSPFDSDFPDLELWIPLTKRFNVAIRKIFGFPDPSFQYSRNRFSTLPHEPIPANYQGIVSFNYEQGWSYGAGFSFNRRLAAGLSVRHAKYWGTGLNDAYLTFEFGALYNVWKDLNLALVLRDFFPWQIETSERYYGNWYGPDPSNSNQDIYYWDIEQWKDVRLKPEPYAEVGVSYMFFNTIETLFDYSSRKEYSWGVRFRFGKGFSIFGGQANRYDHLFKGDPYKNASIGCRINYKIVSLSVSGVWHQERYFQGNESNLYGKWEASQLTNDGALFSLGFSF